MIERNRLDVDIKHSTTEPRAEHSHTQMQKHKVFRGICQNGNINVFETHRFITNFAVYLFFVLYLCGSVFQREMWTMRSVHLCLNIENSFWAGPVTCACTSIAAYIEWSYKCTTAASNRATKSVQPERYTSKCKPGFHIHSVGIPVFRLLFR